MEEVFPGERGSAGVRVATRCVWGTGLAGVTAPMPETTTVVSCVVRTIVLRSDLDPMVTN